MDLSAPVDLYCERLGPGLTAEPLNALSNFTFLLASAWLLLRARGAGSPPYARVLPAIIFLIGLGSLSFHVLATRGTEILDALFIAVFVHYYVACWFRHFYRWPWSRAVLAMLAFLLLNAWYGGAVPADLLNGSAGYLLPLAALLLMAIALLATRRAGGARLAAAATVFLLSLYLRTMDMAWCPSLPIGTHWLWHCLNAVTLTLITLSLDPPPARGAAA